MSLDATIPSDAKLLETGRLEAYCLRFRDKSFVVYCKDRRAYVESIDTFDGATEWTSNPKHARIFKGYAWAKVWVNKNRVFYLPENLP